MNPSRAKLGMRVTYIPEPGCHRQTSVTGTIVKIYPAYTFRDEDTDELIHCEARPCVQVDRKPEWWAYPNNDKFCPDFDELHPEAK